MISNSSDSHVANGRNQGWLRSVKTPIRATFCKVSTRYLGRMVREGSKEEDGIPAVGSAMRNLC